jgi:hypothetical protein
MTARVKGSPEVAVVTLDQAVLRGTRSLVVIGAVAACHLAATTGLGLRLYYQERCDQRYFEACAAARRLTAEGWARAGEMGLLGERD